MKKENDSQPLVSEPSYKVSRKKEKEKKRKAFAESADIQNNLKLKKPSINASVSDYGRNETLCAMENSVRCPAGARLVNNGCVPKMGKASAQAAPCDRLYGVSDEQAVASQHTCSLTVTTGPVTEETAQWR